MGGLDKLTECGERSSCSGRTLKAKSMIEFEGVIPALGQALDKRGYTALTPVQEAVLAPELKDADVLVSAQTGSGKTVAFGLAIAPTLLNGADHFGKAPAPLGLVVAPTRELAMQVKRELQWLYEITGASIASCVGGMDMRSERQALARGAHIVVGTPGRLRDHIDRGSLNTTQIRAVVLDEADEMLDLGFREELEFILNATPSERRTLMFSATVPRSIATLAKRYQRDAVRVSTSAEHSQHLDIEYRALTIAPNDQENAIVNVLRYFDAQNALVFCSTRATVNHMTSRFINRGFSVVALSGELSQNERTHALQAMRDGRARVCIATDVAARGIDLPNLELVIHADLPKNREALLHRSGRTGRAGRKGVCTLIVPHNARKRTERLLDSANIQATWGKPPSADDIMQRDRERILTAPTLSETLSEFEQTFAQELLARHSPEHIAAAFVRQHLAEQSAPEELRDIPLHDHSDRGDRNDRGSRKEKRRDDFTGGVWFSLSIGRAQSSEPRWVLPMLCRWGNITKTDIGAIKVHQSETHVELAPGCVDKFLKAIGPSRTVEKTVIVTRLAGAPKPPSEKTFEKPRENTRTKKPQGSHDRPFREPSAPPLGDSAGNKDEKKPKKKDKDRIKEKKKEKKKAKKAHKSKFSAKVGVKSGTKVKKSADAEPGSSPLMRKKPRPKDTDST